MITGIIFACMVETKEVVDNFEDTPGMVFYALCDPGGEPA